MNEAVHSEILVLVWRRARTSIECVQENEYVPLKVCVARGRAASHRARERRGAVRRRELRCFPSC